MDESVAAKRKVLMSIERVIEDFYFLPLCQVGGPLHIILDDGNVSDEHLEMVKDVSWWVKWARQEGVDEHDIREVLNKATDIVNTLKGMSEQQREELYENNRRRLLAQQFLW